MNYQFAGKVAMITGGTSGIGLEAARQLLAQGAKTALIGRQKEKGQMALLELASYADHVCFIQGDVSSVNQCQEVVEKTAAQFGGLDIVINAAGIYMEKIIGEVTEDEFDHIMNINIKGTYFICKSALPYLRQRGGGAIINVSSDAGINGNCLCTAYCASKGAVTTFTKALSLESIHYGVRANCICPGDVDTPMLTQQLAEADNPEEYLRDMASMYPIGRIAKVHEVAHVICFLASDHASFVNGAVWTVDGGLTAC
ncbi:NAD(P)-dependent dehydrogenase, short-chain alcohol dehydrogenase family [Pelosinus fermentans]|uniref:Short-chain dehydrogenase/reductase SDR n=1 Tax=Pelosinus fermentans B4 TaxID=1149862 RepID=I8RH98_9FIRM|nr:MULTISPECIES: SDR family NAD(P)-dependent oxidoreductase [Pelosinus]EIW19088.1 short-chain dehydrogenase/reductase SDR [Pelosinus fermentans B4]OAM95450.1 3-oxoacyl-(acyl-carrier-protein) reductase [Pelosinus fermentans DSM 17108]SDR28206.1 NAD(P)-dependent dehydrogenase, short-chain alcohol dehydrogenase family [Pelosinus fermentans]